MTTAILVTLSSTGTTETIPGDRPAIGAAALRVMWSRTFRGEECPEEIHDVDPSGDSGIPAFLADVADRAVTLSTVAIGGQGYVLLPGEGVDGVDCWAHVTIEEAVEAPAGVVVSLDNGASTVTVTDAEEAAGFIVRYGEPAIVDHLASKGLPTEDYADALAVLRAFAGSLRDGEVPTLS